MGEVPLKPIGKDDIRRLELALLLTTLMRTDVVEKIKSAEDKLTWLDSLIVAAATLARDRAGYPVSIIANELSRSEATIRNHLLGKTEAGRLVLESYELLKSSGGRIPIGLYPLVEIEQLKKRIEELEKMVKEKEETLKVLNEKFNKVKQRLSEILKELE